MRSLPFPPKVETVREYAALVERVAEHLLHATWHCCRGDDPEVFIAIRIHHFIGRKVHRNKTRLVDDEHQHKGTSKKLNTTNEGKQWVASQHPNQELANALVWH